MGQYFTHNPTLWFDYGDDKDKKPEKIKGHLEERAQDGHSFYDWINFCDYLSSLNLEVVKAVANQKVAVDNATFKTASNLFASGSNLLKEELALENTHDLDFPRERAFVKNAAAWNGQVYRDVLPNLPFVSDYTIPLADRRDFLNPVDYSALGNFVQTMLTTGLPKFLTGAGYPGTLENFEEWQTKIRSYVALFTSVQSWDSDFDGEVFDDFVSFFPSIWD